MKQTGLLLFLLFSSLIVSAIFFSQRTMTANCALPQGLVGYWNFDEGNGITAHDSSGAGNDGTLTGNPTWTPGKVGYALTFNGTNYVDCGNTASLHVQSYTLAAWIKPSALNDSEHRIISNAGWGNYNGAVDFVIASNGKLVVLHQFGYGQDECWSKSGSLLKVGLWSFVAATYNATTHDVKLYVNGVFVNTTVGQLIAPNPNPSYNMRIGTIGNIFTMPFNGAIDEVQVYNRALGLVELQQIFFAAGTGYVEPMGLVGSWNLDQDSGTTAIDNSGNGNSGTVYGASWTTSGKINGALGFDGVNDYVDCGKNETLDPTQNATVEAWVNFAKLPSAAGHHMEIASRSGVGTDLDLQAETNNKFRFYVGAGAVVSSNTVAESGKWYHVTATYQAYDSIRIYVNGLLEATTLIGGARGPNSNSFSIGQSLYWSGRFFNGTIDEVKMFNRSLSAQEVWAEYDRLFVTTAHGNVTVNAGQSVQFTSNVSGGTAPYIYQWYVDGSPVSGATDSSWTFTPTNPGFFGIYLKVADNSGTFETSNSTTVQALPAATPTPTPTPTASPTSSPSPTPTPVIPELSPWIILPLTMIIAITIAAQTGRKRTLS